MHDTQYSTTTLGHEAVTAPENTHMIDITPCHPCGLTLCHSMWSRVPPHFLISLSLYMGSHILTCGSGPEVDSEVKRVKAAGGWIHDGRVCNILAVSRAFGDWEFKVS